MCITLVLHAHKQHSLLSAFAWLVRSNLMTIFVHCFAFAAGAAAGGASARGDEVKAAILSLVGTDKAKQEACFSLEQVVFRAVLAGQ